MDNGGGEGREGGGEVGRKPLRNRLFSLHLSSSSTRGLQRVYIICTEFEAEAAAAEACDSCVLFTRCWQQPQRQKHFEIR